MGTVIMKSLVFLLISFEVALAGSGKCATLYEHANMKGSKFLVWEDSYWPTLYYFDLKISSVRIEPGCTIYLYKEKKFNGQELETKKNLYSMPRPDWNNSVRSVKCKCN